MRYTNGSHAWKLVHRRKMEIALEQTHPLTLAVLGIKLDGRGKLIKLDDAWDVHHMEKYTCVKCSANSPLPAAGKTHNCLCNLLLVPHSFHAIFFEDK